MSMILRIRENQQHIPAVPGQRLTLTPGTREGTGDLTVTGKCQTSLTVLRVNHLLSELIRHEYLEHAWTFSEKKSNRNTSHCDKPHMHTEQRLASAVNQK